MQTATAAALLSKLPSSPLPAPGRRRPLIRAPRCSQPPEAGAGKEASAGKSELRVGSPVIVVEAPPTLKTATAMPSLRINSGLVKPGDVGRIVARKPKDVWAVRLAIGTYLIDGKHFQPLDVDDASPRTTSDD